MLLTHFFTEVLTLIGLDKLATMINFIGKTVQLGIECQEEFHVINFFESQSRLLQRVKSMVKPKLRLQRSTYKIIKIPLMV